MRPTARQLRSNCSRNPEFAHPVLMIIRNCSLILGTYMLLLPWPWCSGEQRGGGLPGLRAGREA
jgi:hypothetical protein